MIVLHLGCGRKQFPDVGDLFRYVGLDMQQSTDDQVIHLDRDMGLQPDLVCDLGEDEIPLGDDSVDIVIAWHVLEHVGQTGQADGWFHCWEEIYRVLKPSGLLYGESPYYTGIWAWSDPTHVRPMSEHSFVFFSQDSYRIPQSAISPYRILADFTWGSMKGLERGYRVITSTMDPRIQNLRFALVAKKPFLAWWAPEDGQVH